MCQNPFGASYLPFGMILLEAPPYQNPSSSRIFTKRYGQSQPYLLDQELRSQLAGESSLENKSSMGKKWIINDNSLFNQSD